MGLSAQLSAEDGRAPPPTEPKPLKTRDSSTTTRSSSSYSTQGSSVIDAFHLRQQSQSIQFLVQQVGLPEESGVHSSSKDTGTHQTRNLNSLDLERHQADSAASYERYFSIICEKMDGYQILPENAYNMDGKGFPIGRITKARRVFSKPLKTSGKLLGAGQDGSREQITVIATICGDRTALPLVLIYKSTSGSIQDSWVQDFESNEHDAWFTSSTSSWTSDEIGFKSLEEFFDKKTRDKARRQWRLLFVDGHGSHVTLKFLKWAWAHKILVAVQLSQAGVETQVQIQTG